MKDNMDNLLKEAYKPNMEPGKELNASILAQAGKKKKPVKTVGFRIATAAAAVLAVICITPLGVYATNQIINKVFIAENSISVGNPEFVDDEAINEDIGDVEVEYVSSEEGDDSVNWNSKEVQIVNGYATNTYYRYDDYATAILDSKLDNWFSVNYEKYQFVTYCITETDSYKDESIDAQFLYNEGTVTLYQSKMSGNVAEDMTFSVPVEQTTNVRTYTSTVTGSVFTLVDDVNGDTYVMINYDNYYGFLQFSNLSDEEIHKILDTVVMKDSVDTQPEETDTTTAPSTEEAETTESDSDNAGTEEEKTE